MLGTNDLKQDGSNPDALARNISGYAQNVISKHPSVQVFLPGVLPVYTPDSVINTRVCEYNHFIRDFCISHPR